jgi:hypothetical protein
MFHLERCRAGDRKMDCKNMDCKNMERKKVEFESWFVKIVHTKVSIEWDCDRGKTEILPEVNVMTSKRFSPKNWQKNGAFVTKKLLVVTKIS